MNQTENILQIDAVNKTYMTGGAATEVLKNVSINIVAGDAIAITGPSGAGKSTLLHILGTLDHPSSGRILYKGDDLFLKKKKNLAQFRNRKLGFVFQFHYLMPELDAVENTMMPALMAGVDKSQAAKKAKQILVRMGLEKRFSHKPGELSGGEQQRIAVARAIVMEPEIVLADEPTGNLDYNTGMEVFNLLLELNHDLGMTLIFVTHNKEFSSRMPRSMTLVDGVMKDC